MMSPLWLAGKCQKISGLHWGAAGQTSGTTDISSPSFQQTRAGMSTSCSTHRPCVPAAVPCAMQSRTLMFFMSCASKVHMHRRQLDTCTSFHRVVCSKRMNTGQEVQCTACKHCRKTFSTLQKVQSTVHECADSPADLYSGKGCQRMPWQCFHSPLLRICPPEHPGVGSQSGTGCLVQLEPLHRLSACPLRAAGIPT